ncbi:hypothetical protein MRS76_12615, partial [Rhizobiaceae bacterium n13]
MLDKNKTNKGPIDDLVGFGQPQIRCGGEYFNHGGTRSFAHVASRLLYIYKSMCYELLQFFEFWLLTC